jgi:hypothetical protein
VQRFIVNEAGQERQVDYCELTHQFQTGYFSDNLKAFAAYYSNRLSYEDTEELLSKLAGSQQLSDQKIQHLVVDKALAVSQALTEETQVILHHPTQQLPAINGQVDIDEATETEMLLLDDALQVKGQKETRERRKSDEQQPVEVISQDREAATERARVSTEVMMLEKKQGSFEYITEVIGNEEKAPLP